MRWISCCFALILGCSGVSAASNAFFVAEIGRNVDLWVETGKAFSPGEGLLSSIDSAKTGLDTLRINVLKGKTSKDAAPVFTPIPPPSDSLRQLVEGVDSLTQFFPSKEGTDSLGVDSLFRAQAALADTALFTISPDGLEGDVDYEALDSIVYSIRQQKIYLYGTARVVYGETDLQANYIEFDWANQTVSAWGVPDSTGEVLGKPLFKEGSDGFTADTIRFNFKSKKGKIVNMRTEQQGGFLGFEQSKRNEYEEIYGYKGYYTTCNNPDPHFHIQANKVKLIPGELVVTGPANLVIADVPTPLFLPFAIFPMQKDRQSGLLLPEYGESQQLGFYLRNGGWYFAISDYFDLAVTGDIYSRGSWRTNLASSYRKRYGYTGRITANYANTRFGIPLESDFRVTRDFKITWNHSQDAKSRPNSRFSANVTAGTSTYTTNATFTTAEFLNNQFSSNISYSKSFSGKPYRLDASIQHNQVLADRSISLTLPNVVFSVNRINPFEKKVRTGTPKWFEQIGFSYRAEARNQITTTDSLLFTSQSLDQFRFGVKHNLPVTTSFKVFKYFTLSLNSTYNEYWYPNYIVRSFQPEFVFDEGDSTLTYGFVETDTLNGFRAARFFNASSSLSTRLFSTANFRGKKLKAIRHVITPSINASYQPDFGATQWNYYGEYTTNAAGSRATYSKFANGIFGAPPTGRLGSLGFSLNNVLEAKVLSKSDSVATDKKISLLDALNIAGSYNFAADSFRVSNITVGGRTRLLDRIDINFNSSFDPYSRDSLGRRNRESEWIANNRLLRFSTGSLAISTRFNGGQTAEGRNKPRWQEWDVWDLDPGYADFNIPWSLSVNYNITVRNVANLGGGDSIATTQTITLNGDFNLTERWKVRFNSGYDFQRKDFTLTTISIDRDLHCWQMGFTWIPFGTIRSYNFTINVKSAVLQDLRINRKQDWYDDF